MDTLNMISRSCPLRAHARPPPPQKAGEEKEGRRNQNLAEPFFRNKLDLLIFYALTKC
ncbi:hypothetical protein MNBD_ALPHA06-181 [hydrothermal vent metagenome]|uniref:Uncharacterized protein n=1 Tax=hydrothermal vent metagenome TaxID=652676 RepID=A0A3B0RF25_9ZZZZ